MATGLNTVWLLRDPPTDVRTRLRLPSPDQGIDLVAKTHDGEFWEVPRISWSLF
jgi:hypothetical protein